MVPMETKFCSTLATALKKSKDIKTAKNIADVVQPEAIDLSTRA